MHVQLVARLLVAAVHSFSMASAAHGGSVLADLHEVALRALGLDACFGGDHQFFSHFCLDGTGCGQGSVAVAWW